MARLLVFAVLGALLAPAITCSQPYPSRPIRLIVASAVGSLPDIATRSMANELGSQMGQSVVVDNRPGASGIVGYEIIARAVPDGYTFGYITIAVATNPGM